MQSCIVKVYTGQSQFHLWPVALNMPGVWHNWHTFSNSKRRIWFANQGWFYPSRLSCVKYQHGYSPCCAFLPQPVVKVVANGVLRSTRWEKLFEGMIFVTKAYSLCPCSHSVNVLEFEWTFRHHKIRSKCSTEIAYFKHVGYVNVPSLHHRDTIPAGESRWYHIIICQISLKNTSWQVKIFS